MDEVGLSPQANAREWTIAIDLKLTMKDGDLGAQQKSQSLQDLKEESRGKPVSLVVQVSTPMEKNSPVSRYLINDGDIQPLPAPQIKDPSGLTSDLLRYAGASQPSKHLGLVLFSHGLGAHGLNTDLGPVSLDSLKRSMGSALSQLHKSKVDLLAFDGCSMAQAETLAKMSPVAEHIAASAEIMPCDVKNTCGLNLNKWMSDLLEHPHMSAGEVADSAVNTVRQEFDLLPGGEAIPTLAHFDLLKYPAFAHALDDFGEQLTETLKVTGNKQAILNIVASTPEYERFYLLDPPYPAPKDLAGFAEQIKAALADGRLKDPGGKLAAATAGLESAQKQMMPSYFGAHQNEANNAFGQTTSIPLRAQVTYDRLGGLSIALPDNDQIADAAKVGKRVEQLISDETQIPSWKAFLLKLLK